MTDNVVPVPFSSYNSFNQILVGSTKPTGEVRARSPTFDEAALMINGAAQCWPSLMTCITSANLPDDSAVWANTCQVDIARTTLLLLLLLLMSSIALSMSAW